MSYKGINLIFESDNGAIFKYDEQAYGNSDYDGKDWFSSSKILLIEKDFIIDFSRVLYLCKETYKKHSEEAENCKNDETISVLDFDNYREIVLEESNVLNKGFSLTMMNDEIIYVKLIEINESHS